VDYSSHPSPFGLGPIGNHNKDALGLLLHTTLVFTLDGLPLGILSHDVLARSFDKRESEKRHTPIDEKESYKWIRGLEESASKRPAGVQVITLADRESDVYEFLLKLRSKLKLLQELSLSRNSLPK
jgi:hypothetical protein